MRLALQHDVERLHHGQAGLDERRELLSEDQDQVLGYPPGAEREHDAAQGRSRGEEVEPLALQLGPQALHVRRWNGLLDHFAGGRPNFADVIHQTSGVLPDVRRLRPPGAHGRRKQDSTSQSRKRQGCNDLTQKVGGSWRVRTGRRTCTRGHGW